MPTAMPAAAGVAKDGTQTKLSRFYSSITAAEREEIDKALYAQLEAIALRANPPISTRMDNPPSNLRRPITAQLLTQNVRGFAKARGRTGQWFDGLRSHLDRRQVDVVMLQETRATALWAEKLSAQYARSWGLRPEKLLQPLSHWGVTPTAAGGAAILLHPQSSFVNLEPLWQDWWGPNLVAVHGEHDNKPVTLVCVYAPAIKKQREAFYRQLSTRTPPPGMIVMGGDFNCVLDEHLDRSHPTAAMHDSEGLAAVLAAWQVVDSATTAMVTATTPSEVMEFRAATHTYSYVTRHDVRATSRLDRWYVSQSRFEAVAETVVQTPCCPSDHDAVILRLVDPTSPTASRKRQGRRALRYPLKPTDRHAVEKVSEAFLTEWEAHAPEQTAAASAALWDSRKTELRRQCLVEQRLSAQKVRRTIKQRLRRLRAQLHDERRRLAPLELSGGASDVDVITRGVALLSIDPIQRASEIRTSIVALTEERTAYRRQAKFDQYAGTGADASRAFYRRISLKYGKRIHQGFAADRLARDWIPIIQQTPPSPEAMDSFFEALPPRVGRLLATAMDEAFTVDEVLAAIKASPRGKASGPDGIPNDWYKDHSERLAPILAPLFTHWYNEDCLPKSFGDATVYCLPKTASPQSGLDFRPISLLNADYKIYSRLLLTRICNQLPHLLAATQFGFVPGRQVHDAIDLCRAVQALVAAGKVPETVTAVLLDFAKAYDTLDRTFLRRALQRHGFSPALVRAVDRMHLATTAAYLSDGELSGQYDVLNGIRQGCPLAPVLFILALDLLYERIDAEPGIAGVQLEEDCLVKTDGFADDTTTLITPEEEPVLLRVLDEFGDASGLRVNLSKCQAVSLHPAGPTDAHRAMTIPVAKRDQHIRMLGATIASRVSSHQVWNTTVQQLRASLHLAEVKTTDLLQRVLVCKTIVMPKLLFVGHHEWPTRSTMQMLQRVVKNYCWHGSLSTAKRLGRAWMSSTVAAMPAAEGGLAIPDVQAEFHRMSEKRITRWANASGVLATVGRILMQHQAPTLTIRHNVVNRGPVRARHAATMAANGVAALQRRVAMPRSVEESALMAPLLRRVGHSTLSTKSWSTEGLICTYSDLAPALVALRLHQASRYGNISLDGLMATKVFGSGVLHTAADTEISRAGFRRLAAADAVIGDVLSVHYVAPNVIHFKCKRHEVPMHPSLAILYKRFCDIVAFNYPAILLPRNPTDVLQARPATHTVWRLRKAGDGHDLVHSPTAGSEVVLGAVSSIPDANRLAKRHGASPRHRFEPHVWLSPYVPIWTKDHLRPAVASSTVVARPAPGLAEVKGRDQRSLAQHPAIAQALRSVSWGAIGRLDLSTSSQRLLFHKIKGLRLSGWDRVHKRQGCPHCPLVGSRGGHMGHCMWECRQAQLVWDDLRDTWRRLGLWRDAQDPPESFLHAVFALKLPRVPVGAISLGGDVDDSTFVTDELYSLLNTAWRLMVLSGFQTIWGWRHSGDDAASLWAQPEAVAFSARGQAHALRSLIAHYRRLEHPVAVRVVYGLLAQLQADAPPVARLPPTVPTTQHILFFDGGSRGNPGPGGSGAVLVATDMEATRATVIWTGAMSYAASTTTNNQAEYKGLITGLHAARRDDLPGLSVVGDSALILGQLRHYRAPKKSTLLALYRTARRLADQHGVTHWRHHYRHHNKMADAAANVAMDSRASIQSHQPSPRLEWIPVLRHLRNDFQQWQASTPTGLHPS